MIARIREALRRWLGVPDVTPEDLARTEAYSLLQSAQQEAMRAVHFYRKHVPQEELRALSERLDALQQALGVQVVAAPAGTGAEASITPVDTAALKEHRRIMDAEVLVRDLRRMVVKAARDAAEIERLRERAALIHKHGDNPA